MFRLLVAVSVIAFAWGEEEVQRPIYKVRYESADLATDATIPFHGYYPIGIGGAGGGFGGGIGAGRFIGGGGIGGAGGFYPGIVGIQGAGIQGAGIGGAGIGIGGVQGLIGGGGIGIGGGEFIDKQAYNSGKKNANDLHYEKANEKKGEEFEQGQNGFNQGKHAVKNVKGDSGYYSGEEAGKKKAEDEKAYHGGKLYNQEGKKELEKKEKKGHKKGHVIKGYKNSHHKDETGKTEEYYDEESDEGANFLLNGQRGAFGENAQSQYKGAKEDAEFKADKGKKEGHHGSEYISDDSKADHGQYGKKKFGESGAIYGIDNGFDQHSLLGHQENSKYFKHYPHHAPFFG